MSITLTGGMAVGLPLMVISGLVLIYVMTYRRAWKKGWMTCYKYSKDWPSPAVEPDPNIADQAWDDAVKGKK